MPYNFRSVKLSHKLILSAVLLLSLGACGWMSDDKGIFVDRSDDYLDSVEQPELIIPEDLDSTPVVDTWPVPVIGDHPRERMFSDKAPRPSAIFAHDTREEVRIQRLGSRRWMVIPEPPSTVWPKLKQFLADNGISTISEKPEDGQLDTQWLTIEEEEYKDVVRMLLRDSREQDAVTTGQDRFRIRLEQGLRERSSEIHLRHENDANQHTIAGEVMDTSALISHSEEAESEALREIGAYLAAKVSQQAISMVAQEISTETKAQLEKNPQGEPVLKLNLDYDRAWATLGKALESAAVEVVEADKKTGTFDVSIPNSTFTGEEPGFFSRLNPFSDADDIHDLEIRVSDLGKVHYVTVRSPTDELIEENLSKQVLLLIRDFAG